jgi:hypothetical protein
MLEGFEAHARIARVRRARAARERCLAALAAELCQHGVGELVIEGRQVHEDAPDRRVLLRARQDGVTSRTLQWRFGKPLGEPLLWVPDAIAGVVGHALVGRDPDRLIERLPRGLRHQVWSGDASERTLKSA